MTKEKERRSFGGFMETMVGASGSDWLLAIGYWLLPLS
jgi:hypothetical protein